MIVRLIMLTWSLTEDLTVTCDEVIDAVAKSYNNISETVLINSNSNKETYKMDIIFSTLFY